MNIDQTGKSNLTRGINDLSVCGLYIVTDTRNFAISIRISATRSPSREAPLIRYVLMCIPSFG